MTMAILLLAFETAPVHKKVFGVIDYKTQAPFGLGIDRQWLAFFQYTTGLVFADYVVGQRDPFERIRRRQGLRPQGANGSSTTRRHAPTGPSRS